MTMDKLSVDSLIFDLDGTLWDTTATCAKAWQSVIDNLDFINISISQRDIRRIAGTQHDLIFQTLFPTLTEPEHTLLTRLCGEAELNYISQYGGELFGNLGEIFTDLSSTFNLFIVSNCQDGYIESFLNYYKLNTFIQDFECSGRTLENKTHNIRRIIQRNNLKTPVYIGDTQGDSDAACGNQIPFIYAAYGFGTVDSFDKKISSLAELKQNINACY
jgi:phosphoglycolate phosphatase